MNCKTFLSPCKNSSTTSVDYGRDVSSRKNFLIIARRLSVSGINMARAAQGDGYGSPTTLGVLSR